MDIPKDITYCIGRANTIYEVKCKNCERFIRLYDFRGQIFSMADLSPKNGSKKCEYFMERE